MTTADNVFKFGIYAITCLASGRTYIGQSAFVEKRLKIHLMALARGNHCNTELQSDAKMYGINNIKTELLCKYATKEEVLEAESALIRRYSKAGKTYNIAIPKIKKQRKPRAIALSANNPLYKWRIANRYTRPAFLKMAKEKGLSITVQTLYNWETEKFPPGIADAEIIRTITGGEVKPDSFVKQPAPTAPV